MNLVKDQTGKQVQKRTIIVFIKDHWLHNLYEVVIDGLEVDIVEKIKKAKSKNKEVVRVVLGTVHTRVEVHRMDLEMSRLVE